MSNPKEFYPPVSFSFQLSMDADKEQNASFQELSGIIMEMNVDQVAPGRESRFKGGLPGSAKYDNLVLKRGVLPKESSLAEWVMNTPTNAIQTKDISVALTDTEGKVLMSWVFINAFPVKWEVSDFKSAENVLTVESLEFAYSYCKKN